MNTDIRAVILTTTVDDDQAVDRLIAALLEPRIAACAQVSTVHSVFWWQGRLQQADESRIQVKLPSARVDDAIAAVGRLLRAVVEAALIAALVALLVAL